MKIKANIHLNLDFNLKIGRIIKALILSDLFLLAGWGFISPIFSVFIINKVAGATLTTVGIATALYWLIKSLIQIPIANYLDRTEGEQDDFYALIASLLLAGVAAFGYVLVHTILSLYFFSILQAIAFGIYTPAWSGIFGHHLDEKRKAFDYSLDSTAIGISSGITGLIGGAIAQYFGFNIIFILGGILSLIAAGVVLSFPKLVLPAETSKTVDVRDRKMPIV